MDIHAYVEVVSRNTKKCGSVLQVAQRNIAEATQLLAEMTDLGLAPSPAAIEKWRSLTQGGDEAKGSTFAFSL